MRAGWGSLLVVSLGVSSALGSPLCARAQDDLLGPTGQPVVHSADDARDLVRLRDGGVIRGVVVLWRPGARVVIRTPDGVDHELAADVVASVEIERDPSDASLLPMPAPGPMEARRLGDPDDIDPTTPVDPRMIGRTWRLGLQLASGYHVMEHPWIPSAGYAELGVALEVRLLPELHLRFAALFWIDEPDSTYFADEVNEISTDAHVGGVGARGRILVGYDLTHHIAIRLGGELGFVSVGRLMWVGGATVELSWRIIRGFEIALSGGPSVRPGWQTLVDSSAVPVTSSEHDDHAIGVRLGVQLGYLF